MKNLETEAFKANQHFEERLLPKGEAKSENSEPSESEHQENPKEPEMDEGDNENSSNHEEEAGSTEDTVEEPKKDK